MVCHSTYWSQAANFRGRLSSAQLCGFWYGIYLFGDFSQNLVLCPYIYPILFESFFYKKVPQINGRYSRPLIPFHPHYQRQHHALSLSSQGTFFINRLPAVKITERAQLSFKENR